MIKTSSQLYDVIIVGLGPTGATLANILGGYGIDVLVLEREAGVYPLPRAVHFDDEAMRVFQSVGLSDSIVEEVRVNVGTKFVDKDQNLLLDWSRPQEIGPLGWYPSYRFHQPDLEAQLNVGIASHDYVQVMRSATVTDIEMDDDGVTVTFTKDDATHHDRAAYVVGTDGARSIVRAAIGGEWEDLGFKERWLVVDVQLTADRSDLGDFTIQTCDQERPTTYVRCPRDWRRWEISLKPDETPEDVTRDDFIWNKLRPAITPDEGLIRRKAVYHFESKLAENWQSGRAFVAGDAAHLMPPFMGQGMCTGIRDAANLGWKLAAVLKWGAPPSLLESYETERRSHTRTYVETAVRVGHMMNSAQTAESLTDAISPDGSAKMNSISRGLDNAIGLPADADRGTRMPQPRLSDGTRLSDVMAGRFAVLASTELLSERPVSVMSDAAIELARENHPEIDELLTARQADALIVRPDFYCFARVPEGKATHETAGFYAAYAALAGQVTSA